MQLEPCEDKVAAMAIIGEMVNILNRLLAHHLDSVEDGIILQSFPLVAPDERIDKDPVKDCSVNCRSDYSRTVAITALQTIFLFYLAALPEAHSQEILFDTHSENEQTDFSQSKDATRRQLLVEAELLRVAIDMSDSDVL